MFRSRVAQSFLIAAALAASACSDDDGDDVQLDDSQLLSNLNDAQLGELCDWSNEAQGGYNKQIACANGGTATTQKDQATCKAEDAPVAKRCEQTVGAYKACTLKLAMNPCDFSAALVSQECLPLLPCLSG